MSKKTRPRRSAQASSAQASSAPASSTPASSAPANSAPASSTPATKADEAVERVLSSLWTAIGAGDPLRAELESVSIMGLAHAAGKATPDHSEEFIADVLIAGASRRRAPEGAALLRVLMSLGSPGTKRTASQALAQLTSRGVYPLDWVTEIGKVTPGQAWRRYDVFGDAETIAATFSYGEAEHGIMVRVDLTSIPMAASVGVATDAASLIEAISRDEDPFDRPEQISLPEARRRLEAPLDRLDHDPDPRVRADTLVYLPIARSRVRRLPAGDDPQALVFSAADRATAVDDFMKSPLAAEAVTADEASTRFWAEVLTGYSSRIPGESPAQVGPRKLAHMLLGHVPNTFMLSPAQRKHLEPAITAWTRWSAAYRNLNEAETARLTESLANVFARFDEAYDNPGAAAMRGYLSDLAASDADVAWLARNVARRMFAVPMPEKDDGGVPQASDPAVRRALAEAEFTGCTPPDGMTGEQFVAAAHRVIEELWHDDPETTMQAARRMFAEGRSRHDIIHTLAG